MSDLMKCGICKQDFDCSNLSEVFEHEHTEVDAPEIIGTPKAKKYTAEQSTNVSEISYSDHWKTMDIITRDGNCYRYREVPREVFESAFYSINIGRFWAQEIKGRYPYYHVNGD